MARLKSHMKLHEEDKPFICDVCGKRYHDQNAVKLHMVGHLEVLPFPCTYCDKRFRHKGLLNVSRCELFVVCLLNKWIKQINVVIFQVHIRTHTGYRPYACEHCSYAATSSANLRNHTLRKHGIDLHSIFFLSRIKVLLKIIFAFKQVSIWEEELVKRFNYQTSHYNS